MNLRIELSEFNAWQICTCEFKSSCAPVSIIFRPPRATTYLNVVTLILTIRLRPRRRSSPPFCFSQQ